MSLSVTVVFLVLTMLVALLLAYLYGWQMLLVACYRV